MEQFFGRSSEKKRFKSICDRNKSEFIAVFGRRRIGKTLLIRETFKNNFTFYLTGILNVNDEKQLFSFHTTLENYNERKDENTIPINWIEAFNQLKKYLERQKDKQKVIFIDELPWFDLPKSDFMQALEHFWNHWASLRKDIILITCGSATSWMINKLLNPNGKLNILVTEKFHLKAFTLNETKAMLTSKNPDITDYQIVKLYMALGGVPYYLDGVSDQLSVPQNLQALCFNQNGLLATEFKNLYKALFSKAERHESIVRAIATKTKGLTRQEIIDITKLPKSGRTTALLKELEESGFIRKYKPIHKKIKDSLFQLSDFYSLFYLKFMENVDLNLEQNFWMNTIDNPAHVAWSGYAFEQVCLHHLEHIKKALGISGILTKAASWRSKSLSTKNAKGAQIDLIIDRRDQTINIIEIKFSAAPFTITKNYATKLQQKIDVFKEETKTRKAVHLTMITTYGLVKNEYSTMVRNSLKMDCMFKKLEE